MKTLVGVLCIVYFFFWVNQVAIGQQKKPKSGEISVDKNGVLRWPGGQELKGFGVNYTTPFAYAFRTGNKLGLNLEKEIDADVYHFARLGFDAYRVHVWDTEISDTVGNLLQNEQLRLFDYLVKQLKARGMKILITPIAFWGNGWPEPDTWSPGFAHKYGKDKCLTNPDAILAQKKYLAQFLNHVNEYTGLAYKNDPDIIGFEISNEPHHGEAPAAVTQYIKTMLGGMRGTGCKKPIFYNISHSIHLVDAYYEAGIEGGTFQWYPTGLGFQKEIGGNLLPHVDDYAIPFANNPAFQKKAKLVYEFDAADVNKSYIYPAMARSFRTAGIQWATHFAYDPGFTAHANTEYNTHYMNLAYSPGKAIGLMIASEVFHEVPLYTSYGKFPQNTRFGNFKVDYESNLAEMVNTEKFFYSNSTSTIPTAIGSLKQIAGVGNSGLVQYSGLGAYFLDKIGEGLWRLEIMPDAIPLLDPFGRNSLGKQLTAIQWRQQSMQLNLPDLGQQFSIKAPGAANRFTEVAAEGSKFNITPGVYLCVQKGKETGNGLPTTLGSLGMSEFYAPKSNLLKTQIMHAPATETVADNSLEIRTTIASEHRPDKVFISYRKGRQWTQVPLESKNGYHYAGIIPAADIRAGWFDYWLVVELDGQLKSYPGAVANKPGNWDFDDSKPYRVKILPSSEALTIFNAFADADLVSRQWSRQSTLLPLAEPQRAEMQVRVEKLFVVDNENPNATPVYDYSMRYYFGKKIKNQQASLAQKTRLVLRCRSLEKETSAIRVALIDNAGRAFGAILKPGMEKDNYSLNLSDFKPVPLVIQPRPYPGFLPYFFHAEAGATSLNPANIESLQISIGPGLSGDALKAKHGLAIERIWLE